MPRLAGRLAAGKGQDFGHARFRQRGFAGLARLVAQQALNTLLGEALLPTHTAGRLALARRATARTDKRSADKRRQRYT
jgi:hypothetical protein